MNGRASRYRFGDRSSRQIDALPNSAAFERVRAQECEGDFIDLGVVVLHAGSDTLARQSSIHIRAVLRERPLSAKSEDRFGSYSVEKLEQPIRFTLFINRKTATSLGLTFPTSVLLRVDRVID